MYTCDDVFFIWTDSEEILERFLKELNFFHPNIKFTFEKLKMKVYFLDVVVKIKNGRLSTDLNAKPFKKIFNLQSDFEVKDNLLIEKRSQVPCRRF